MTVTVDQIRAFQRERVARLLRQRLGLAPTPRVPDEDDAGVPVVSDFTRYKADPLPPLRG